MLIFGLLSPHIEGIVFLFAEHLSSSEVIQPWSYINHYLLIFWNHNLDSLLHYLLLTLSLFLVKGLKNHLPIHLIIPPVLVSSRVPSYHCRVEFPLLLELGAEATPRIGDDRALLGCFFDDFTDKKELVFKAIATVSLWNLGVQELKYTQFILHNPANCLGLLDSDGNNFPLHIVQNVTVRLLLHQWNRGREEGLSQ